jgi:putative nucleotidyltransferase with HDIG domain
VRHSAGGRLPRLSRRDAQDRQGYATAQRAVGGNAISSRLAAADRCPVYGADVSQWEPADLALVGDDARLDRIAEAFARVIDAKSPFTARHSENVAQIADGIAAVLEFDPVQRRILRRAGLLHDIGKLAISNRILDKPGQLSDEEFSAIKTHPVHTLRILERAPCFAELADLAANHHEKLDGSGYPRSPRAGDLDVPMRVLAVADVRDALQQHLDRTSGRVVDRAETPGLV